MSPRRWATVCIFCPVGQKKYPSVRPGLTLKSEDDSLAAEAGARHPVTLPSTLPGGSVRHLNGQCVHLPPLAGPAVSTCASPTKPWLWYATQRTDYRIFQHMTAPT